MNLKVQRTTLLMFLVLGADIASAQSTSFTYQGLLNDNGIGANANYDLRFMLYQAASGGTPLDAILTNNSVAISNGLFTTTLDFGDVFDGTPYWLEVGVRRDGDLNDFTTLAPRQPLTPTPYAMQATHATVAASAGRVSGPVPDALLSPNIARLSSNLVFTGAVQFTNPASVFNGTFTGTLNGSAVSIGPSNLIAPLTVSPSIPSSAIGSIRTGTNADATSIAVAGRYAYIVSAESGTLQIVDVSSPASPVLAGSIMAGATHDVYYGDFGPNSVVVADRYAYVANGASNSLQIFDVSAPSRPVLAGSVATGVDPTAVAVAGRYAYVVNINNNTLQIFDVGNPAKPVQTGSVSAGGFPNSIAVVGRFAYVVSLQSSTLEIIDVSNPANPVLAGTVATGDSPYSVAVAGRFAYVVNYQGESLQVFDVANPTNVTTVGSVRTAGHPTSVTVAGRYAYVGNWNVGFQVFDVSDPSSPVSVGSVTTYEWWSLAVSGRYAYVLNDQDTLKIFDMGGAYLQHLEVGAMEAGTLQVRDNLVVGNKLAVCGGFTASGSARITGGLSVDNGSVGIGVSAPSYTLQVNGSVAGVGAYNNISDARYKTNITTLTRALDTLMSLRAVEYDWRHEEYPQMRFEPGRQLGFIAQEVQEVLPQAVSKDAQGYYSIAYSKLIPVLAEAIKEQRQEMNAKELKILELVKEQATLQQQIEALRYANDRLGKRLDALENAVGPSSFTRSSAAPVPEDGHGTRKL